MSKPNRSNRSIARPSGSTIQLLKDVCAFMEDAPRLDFKEDKTTTWVLIKAHELRSLIRILEQGPIEQVEESPAKAQSRALVARCAACGRIYAILPLAGPVRTNHLKDLRALLENCNNGEVKIKIWETIGEIGENEDWCDCDTAKEKPLC